LALGYFPGVLGDMKLLFVALVLASSLFLRAEGAPGTGFPRSTPEAEGVDSAGVLALVGDLEQKVDAVHSLVLVRHGKVVAEGWWAPYAREDTHVLYSVTKSFTATAVGIAAAEGLLSLNDRVISFFPDLAPAEQSDNLKAMRVRDLLRMNSGHQNDTIDRLRTHTDGQWRRAFLALPVENKPGTRFVYNSGGSYMLAAIVQKVSGQTVEAFLTPRLFEPLGIDRHPWALSDEGVALGDGGLSLTTEDLAKFGQLYLQKGMWRGRRLLTEQWVEAATALETSNGGDPDSNWDAGYGYQFWRNKTLGYRADGAQGQFCFVLPELDVVLAITSGTGNTKGIMDAVWAHLLPALHYVALPANAPAQEALTHKLASLTLPVPAGAEQSPRAAAVSGKTYVFPENEQGIETVRLDFAAGNPTLTFKDTEGTHPIPLGLGRWLRGTTTFRKRISHMWDADQQGMAASGAWTDTDTFMAKLCFDETPFIITARLKFDGDKLILDMDHNQRWGEKHRPQIVGRVEAGGN
jgi:CubicO group peptidase (beta-lactamase class C family)